MLLKPTVKITPPKTPYKAERGYRAMIELGEAAKRMDYQNII